VPQMVRGEIEELLKEPPGAVRYSSFFEYDAAELVALARKFGLEGLVAKRQRSRNEAGKRTGSWVKLKVQQEQDFVAGIAGHPQSKPAVLAPHTDTVLVLRRRGGALALTPQFLTSGRISVSL
jgi:hypothetical protein